MAVSDSVSKDTLPTALPGVGRALVMADKLSQKAAEDIYRKAKAGPRS